MTQSKSEMRRLKIQKGERLTQKEIERIKERFKYCDTLNLKHYFELIFSHLKSLEEENREIVKCLKFYGNAPVFVLKCDIEDFGIIDGKARCGGRKAQKCLKKWGRE